jgi:hypothetical protein
MRAKKRIIFRNNFVCVLDRYAFRHPVEITVSVEMYVISDIHEGTKAKAFELREPWADP